MHYTIIPNISMHSYSGLKYSVDNIDFMMHSKISIKAWKYNLEIYNHSLLKPTATDPSISIPKPLKYTRKF
jgi:hypothetical protein